MTEDDTVGWHHQLSGYEFQQTQGDSEGQESPACCSPWGHKESTQLRDWTTTIFKAAGSPKKSIYRRGPAPRTGPGTVSQEKEIKGIRIGKKGIKRTLCAGNIMLYTENAKNSTKKPIGTNSVKLQDSKWTGRSQLYFYSLTRKCLKKKFKNSLCGSIKNLEINLT